ncbi:MAG: hypothetical protein JKY18_12440, partial [Flavobacteriales bacterium]|nr:hypothetical protein [Flavobacteriales bacterium]
MKKRLLCAVALCCLIATSSQAQTTYINEDFSTGFGTTPPLGWTAFIMPFTSNPLVDSFHFDNPGTRVLNAPITDPACIFDSDNLSNDGTAEEVIMISPTFNAAVATVVMLEFDHYFQGLVGSQVYVIVTDGVISDTVYTTTATTPNPESLVIDISATAAGKPSVNVIFAWTGDWSWYWIFDNVLVYSPAANDVGVIAIDAPTSGCGLSATENVTVRIKNFGGVAQGGFPVSYTINGGAPVTETPVTIIPPGDTATYTFTATADLSATGAYSFDAYTSLVTDADNANDSTLGVSVTHEAIISTFPYLEDFEAEPLCGTTCGDPCNLVGSWNNAGGDDMDWTTDEGGTGSGGTGPSADNTTGLATGNYMYTESSGGCNPASEARLV